MMALIEGRHAELSVWLRLNTEKAGTPEYRKHSMAHRILTDLTAHNGGSAEMQAEAVRRLKELGFG